MTNLQKKYKVGIIINSSFIENWKIESLKKIIENKKNELELLIVNKTSNKNGFYEKQLKSFEINRCKNIPNGVKKHDLEKYVNFKHKLEIKLISYGKGIDFQQKDYEEIIKYDLDVLILYDTINLNDKIKNELKLGLWYLYFPESNSIPTFNQVVNNESITECDFIINCKEFSSPKIFLKSYSATDPLYVIRNQNNIFLKTASFFPRTLNNIEMYGEDNFFNSLKQKKDFNIKNLTNIQELNFSRFIKAFYTYTKKYLKIKKYDSKYWDQFCILYNQKSGLDFDFKNFKCLTPPQDKFWADPQLIIHDKKNHVFFEEFSNLENKGWISTMIINNEGCSKPRKIIEESHHLSYPHVFKFENQFYMIPESSQKKTIDLYKCEEFPFKWNFKKSIMKDVTAVDSTIFYHNKKWWLFTGIAMIEGASTSDELFLFYSDNPVSSEWIPHPKNPIISDVRNARPGGHIFEYKGKILRPSQDSSKGYGYGINLNEIIKLNEFEFEEKQIKSLKPMWDNKVKAIHTLEYNDGLTIIDARIQRVKKI